MNTIIRLMLGLLTISMAFVGVIQPSEGDKKAKAQLQEEPQLSLDYLEQAKQKYYAKLRALPWGKVADKYIKQLEAEEKGLMAKWYESSGFSEQEWDGYINKIEHGLFKKHALSNINHARANEQQRTIIDRLLGECFIAPAYITCYRREEEDRLSSTANAIILSSKQQGPAFEASVTHEIMHILHGDALRKACYELGNGNKKLPKNFANEWGRFKERRADILGALSKSAYVQDLMLHFDTCNVEKSNNPHPSPNERAAYMRELHKEINKSNRLSMFRKTLQYSAVLMCVAGVAFGALNLNYAFLYKS